MGLKSILRPFLDTFSVELCTLLFLPITCEINGFKCVLAFLALAALGFSFWLARILVERSKNLMEKIFTNRFGGRYAAKIDSKAVFSHFFRLAL